MTLIYTIGDEFIILPKILLSFTAEGHLCSLGMSFYFICVCYCVIIAHTVSLLYYFYYEIIIPLAILDFVNLFINNSTFFFLQLLCNLLKIQKNLSTYTHRHACISLNFFLSYFFNQLTWECDKIIKRK